MNYLNKTPMYRLVIYALLSIVLVVFVQSFLGFLSYKPEHLALSLLVILVTSLSFNFLFSKMLSLPLQNESTYITSLILFLILLPVEDVLTGVAVFVASVFSVLSKYLITWRNTHIFNPAAFGLTAISLLAYWHDMFAISFWWVGSYYLFPIVLLASVIVVIKTRKHVLFISALAAALLGNILFAYFYGTSLQELLYYTFISGPVIFLAGFMLTEPHTIAKNRNQQIFYGFFIVILPVLFTLTDIWSMPPEFAILVGNLISFISSKRERFILKLKEVVKLNEDIYEYVFTKNDGGNFSFIPGEYLEWNLDHQNADSRSTRRYFTISSRPNISEICFATKFPKSNESSFKQALRNLHVGDSMFASQLGGDFILPRISEKQDEKEIVMIAGGIGITPFISQIRDMLSNPAGRPHHKITLFYCANSIKDIVYRDELKQAMENFQTKVIAVVTNQEDYQDLPDGMQLEIGFINQDILAKHLKTSDKLFYLSGPNVMVETIKKVIVESGTPRSRIHTDYFPGF